MQRLEAPPWTRGRPTGLRPDRFVAVYKGDVMKALKEMMILNGHLQEPLDALSAPRRATR
ncbi:hypothetical protein BQ8482_380225 [Mesorhizobium delmotii]|uniref:Uncharacterized protein n=1 Tax=Mesorhizobium delmotii TaxID=1631247 RepID=A0A2P9ASB9_9HYPH|nr:hypothetical protein BQ8482_380225 [Mesorhizobium delmotii]